ncbi:MAG: TrkA C-terminal domain-containing protein, partial [Erysipelotrichaceae bacterium]|nr:TrkA C-terminal domain-containing protein [Erysipelotrichaceae bacterium]
LLAELVLQGNHKWLSKEIRNLELPRKLVIVSILRNDEVIYPKGNVMLQLGDKIVFVCDKETISGLKKYL